MPTGLIAGVVAAIGLVAACRVGAGAVHRFDVFERDRSSLEVVGGAAVVIESAVAGPVVVGAAAHAMKLTNLGVAPGVVRQAVAAPGRWRPGAAVRLEGRLAAVGGYGTVRVMADVDGVRVELIGVNAVGPGSAKFEHAATIPSATRDLSIEYTVGAGAKLVVDELSLDVGGDARELPTLAPATVELLADVERELRYFSPEVPSDFDWGGWLATADHELRGVTEPASVMAYVDAWVKRAAPHAAYAVAPVVADATPAVTATAATLGPRVNFGPRTDGIYASWVEGSEAPSVGIYPTWELGQASCSKLAATASVERLSGAGGATLYVIANTGEFKAERTVAELKPGEVAASLDVPQAAKALKIVIGVEGTRELVLRRIDVSCDGVTRSLALEDANIRGDGVPLFERRPGGCPGCVTFGRKTMRVAGQRTVTIGPGALTYPLVVAKPGPAARAPVVAGGYGRGDLDVAAAQVLYSELRTFAVKAATRQERLHTAFVRAVAAIDAHEAMDEVRMAVAGMTVALDDGHARVITPFDNGTLPFEIRRFGDRVAVVSVHPQYQATIPVGSLITAIDGTPIVELLTRVGARPSGATPGWKAVAAARWALYGPIGSIGRVTFDNGHDLVRTIGLPRIPKESGLDEILPTKPDQGAEVGPGVRYVRISRIDAAGVETLVPQLAGARAIVLDLRSYGGPGDRALAAHLLSRPVKSPTWSTASVGPAGVTEWVDSSWTLYPMLPHVPAKVVVLTDSRCISAVETLLSVLRSALDVVVVGEPSAGTNGNEVELELPGGFTARYTGMRVIVDGRDYNETPTSVDVPVSWTLADVQAGRDPILERGIAVAAELAR